MPKTFLHFARKLMSYIVTTNSYKIGHFFKCCETPHHSPQWKLFMVFFHIFELLWWSCYLCKVRKLQEQRNTQLKYIQRVSYTNVVTKTNRKQMVKGLKKESTQGKLHVVGGLHHKECNTPRKCNCNLENEPASMSMP